MKSGEKIGLIFAFFINYQLVAADDPKIKKRKV
jgi:hypothetical protein